MSADQLPRLLAGWHVDGAIALAEHLDLHGRLPLPASRGSAELIARVQRSGLRGRGGAAFPVATKLQAVAAAPRRRRRLVLANGAEGEPASTKDSALLESCPHLVLDGVAAAAAAVTADEAIICVKPGAAAGLDRAIAERSGMDRVVPEVVEVPSGYVVGEESSLINYLNTGAALPTYGAAHPSERGVAGRPTLVQNLETLAHLALIARHGPEWFRELGTDEDPGSALIDVTGAVASPGLYEVPAGLPLGALVEMAGGPSAPVQAFLVGGYAGTWTASEQALELGLGHAALRERGGTLGPGIVAALPRSSCGVQETARIARYLADASSGQCGPCVFGLPAIADGLQAIVEGIAEPGAHSWVEYWGQLVAGRGACHHPDGAAQMVASGLRVFADDLTRHETGDSCLASAFDRGAGVR